MRKPRQGDVHALTPRVLRGALRREVPPWLLHGLRRIELRPRPSSVVGTPYAVYLPPERSVVLYSLPPAWVWHEPVPEHHLRRMRQFGARVQVGPPASVDWPGSASLALWFFTDVVLHELGHHAREMERGRRGRACRVADEEHFVDRYADRLARPMLRRLERRR